MLSNSRPTNYLPIIAHLATLSSTFKTRKSTVVNNRLKILSILSFLSFHTVQKIIKGMSLPSVNQIHGKVTSSSIHQTTTISQMTRKKFHWMNHSPISAFHERNLRRSSRPQEWLRHPLHESLTPNGLWKKNKHFSLILRRNLQYLLIQAYPSPLHPH